MQAIRWWPSWLPGLLIVLGCSATADRPRTDAGASGAGAPRPVPTRITLQNTGSAPLVVGNQCGGLFLSLAHDGEDLSYDRACMCACDAPGACGCPAICLNTQALVVPGKSAAVEWDGLYARFEDPSCYELAGLERGDTVTAEACWNESPEGATLACESVDFAYDREREVTISAEHHSAARTPVRIVLDNQSGSPIEIVTDECGTQRWFELALPLDDDGETATLGSFCPCACSADFERDPGSCPVCGGCADPVVETVEPGATHGFEWDGMFWYGYASGCSAQYAMPAGVFLNAQVCFTRRGATERRCQPVFFVTGESDEVFATVQ